MSASVLSTLPKSTLVKSTPVTATSASPPEDALEFDGEAYLRMYPDIAAAVQRGAVASAFEHYMLHGKREGRRCPGRMTGLSDLAFDATNAVLPSQMATAPRQSVDALFLSKSGSLFAVGWVDDHAVKLEEIRFEGNGWSLTVKAEALARLRRDDVQSVLAGPAQYPYGFWLLVSNEQELTTNGPMKIVFIYGSGPHVVSDHTPRTGEDQELRDTVLAFLSNAQYIGNPQMAAMASLEKFIGHQIVNLNRAVTRQIVASPYVERFTGRDRAYKGSIVVCLYGKPEFLFLQSALFAGKPGIEDYEWIFVCNSPELSERLLKEARINRAIYGLDQTLVLLPGNAGFGAANNVGVKYSRSDRVLIVNPDVFPMQPDWAARHTALTEEVSDRTKLFGVPLFYDDGSLMHGGIYFDIDTSVSVDHGKIVSRNFVRAEHYGKGSPPDLDRFTRARPVPAVTGAFMSIDKGWFERLGGFSEDYVFGHYEDADLCLRSLEAGTPAWLHDIRLYHLEGRGSTRRQLHEGGSVTNRWLFSNQWASRIAEELNGPDVVFPDVTGIRTVVTDDAAEAFNTPQTDERAATTGRWPPGTTADNKDDAEPLRTDGGVVP
jgi:GT2 family glycosyltransferase